MGKFKAFFKEYVLNDSWKCNVCASEVFDGEYFCESCKNDLPINDKAVCDHCGRATKSPEKYCLTCKNVITSLDKCRSAFRYEDSAVKMIHRFKFGGKRYYAKIFGEYLEKIYRENGFSADCIVYVPMTAFRKLVRGYNQSELLAGELSSRIGVPVIKNAVLKKKNTKRQAKLDRKKRFENLKGAFKIANKLAVKDKKVLLVDDVTTTGATADTIASLLKKAKAKTVFLLTVASVSMAEGN